MLGALFLKSSKGRRNDRIKLLDRCNEVGSLLLRGKILTMRSSNSLAVAQTFLAPPTIRALTMNQPSIINAFIFVHVLECSTSWPTGRMSHGTRDGEASRVPRMAHRICCARNSLNSGKGPRTAIHKNERSVF
jgi:hypothetical protein